MCKPHSIEQSTRPAGGTSFIGTAAPHRMGRCANDPNAMLQTLREWCHTGVHFGFQQRYPTSKRVCRSGRRTSSIFQATLVPLYERHDKIDRHSRPRNLNHCFELSRRKLVRRSSLDRNSALPRSLSSSRARSQPPSHVAVGTKTPVGVCANANNYASYLRLGEAKF